jgi:hypothetical protein
MKPPGLFEKIDDAINPIVVKELRQAVHSRFVVAVVLLFLIIQLVYLGIHLTFVGLGGQLESVDYQVGRDIYTVLQIILLATCMLFLPAYTGVRLAAERSEVNTDLLFITTLQPRKIISGKLASAVVIAIMIFSACAPFMAFTYFLRGIDLVTIFFFIAVDFLVVFASVVLMVFFAVIPANRVLKAFLGVIGFAILVWVFFFTMAGTISYVHYAGAPPIADPEFWSICGTVLVGYVGQCGLFYAWSVALISAPSANRALPMRAFMLGFALVSGGVIAFICQATQREEPFQVWLLLMGQMVILTLWIAICERQAWTPRVARTIPRNALLRVPAFLLYSGSAGGILFACALAGIAALGMLLFKGWFSAAVPGRLSSFTDGFFNCIGIVAVYMYCYALTAVLIRTWLLRIHAGFTWVLMIFLIALGSLIPFFVTWMLLMNRWNPNEHFYSLLGNPGWAVLELSETRYGDRQYAFLLFSGVWAIVVTGLNLPWFVRQMARFRPYDTASAVALPMPSGDGSSATLPVSS